MKKPVIIMGMGEMGGVFARGFLKAGYPVYPVARQDNMQEVARSVADVSLVLIAVGEKDLASILKNIPDDWRNKLAMLQNELLPGDWKQYSIIKPTVISVWFEKKPGQDFKVLIPSALHGPHAQLVEHALSTLDIPVNIVSDEKQLLFELVRKNLYILTTNICGLQTGGTVKQLWDEHSILMNRVFNDVLSIQQYLTQQTFDRDHLLGAVLTAFDGDPEHQCMGRSAPVRLQRALEIARQARLEVAELTRISDELN